jgi:hypothetical protein
MHNTEFLMSKLNLTFVVEGKKTRTQIGLKSTVNKIFVENKSGGGELQVVFSPGGRIEHEDGKPLPYDTLKLPNGGSATLKFKDKPKIGETVSYTAKIEGADPEDPIIIID